MSELLKQAERIKLARVLNAPVERLDFLSSLEALELRALRERVTHSLFDQHRALFHRLADAGKFLPVAVNALISEKVFGPMLSARVAGMLPAKRAIEISGKLPIRFQAESCLTLDPRSAPEMLRHMPVRTVVEVARVLLVRKEYVTMARFVDCLSDAAIQGVVKDTRDDEALLRIGFYVESAEKLSHVIGLMPDDRLAGVIRCSANGSAELQQAGVSLFSTVNDRQKGRLGDAAANLDKEILGQIVSNLQREKAEAALKTTIANMSESGRQKIQALIV